MKDRFSFPLYSWMIEQFKGDLPCTDDYEGLKQKAREMFLLQAFLLLRKTGQRRPPFDPFATGEQRRIHRITWVDSGDEASLVPDLEGFHLILRRPENISSEAELLKDVRVRSTVAHEVGHTFFFDISHFPPKQGPRFEHALASNVREKEEWWCFDFARKLLLPDRWIKKSVISHNFSGLELASKIRREYNVSWDILLRKLVYDLEMWATSTVFRLDFEDSQVILRNEYKDIWKGARTRIGRARPWLLENADFINGCVGRIENARNKSTEEIVARFVNPSEKYVAEFLPIYRDRPTLLCLVRESDGILDKYLT